MSPVASSAPVGSTLVPPLIRTVPAVAVSEPAPTYVVLGATSTLRPVTAPPIFIEVVVDDRVAVPAVAVTFALVARAVLAVMFTFVAASTAAEIVTVDPVDETFTLPLFDVRVAPELVTAPEPEIDKAPLDCKFPVGWTVVPPVMVKVPAAVRRPEPEYAPDVVTEMFPEFVVV